MLDTDLQGSISSTEDKDYYEIVVTEAGQLVVSFQGWLLYTSDAADE